MGLFGKIFEKKICDICGGEIGLLGNRKLEDGNLCKNCAAKLSPWFSDRRSSTVEEIKEQLSYREQNMEAVERFNTTRSIGRNYKVLLDEDAGKFLVARTKDISTENPDVLDYSQVTGCDLDIRETCREEKRTDKDGKQVSYEPPRYRYSYDFYMLIRVKHPYFDEMSFKLNSSSVELQPAGGGAFVTRSINPRMNRDYREYEEMGAEIKEALTQARRQVREEAAAANAPRQAVTCPWCGATTMPDASGCCEYCGGSVNG